MTTTTTTPKMDDVVLARLTGGLGDKKMLARRGAEIGNLYAALLADMFRAEAGLEVEVAYSDSQSGLMHDLVSGLDEFCCVARGGLRNWCPDFVLACGNDLPIAVMAKMLGAENEDMEATEERPLSKIELDVATQIIGQIAGVLQAGVNAPGGFEPVMDEPANRPDFAPLDAKVAAEFGLAVRMVVKLARVTSYLVVIIPQRSLLKTKITVPVAAGQMKKADTAWFDTLASQVKKSQATLTAHIKLQPLTLRTISRLMAGDVIPFLDHEEVHVEVAANGKEIYACEFGRWGENYTVRVKDNISSDEETLRHLMAG